MRVPVTDDPGSGGPGVPVVGVHDSAQDRFAGTFDVLTGPHRFDQMQAVIRRGGV